MLTFLVPTLLLAATAASLLWSRSRSLLGQALTETVLIIVLGAWLLHVGASPMPTAAVIARDGIGPWIQAVAIIWWLASSRLVVTTTALARGRSRHSREAKLTTDLFAGAIYLTATFIILNTILALPIRGLLATSGIIAVVVGLALQSTLADLFSGIAVGIEQAFHVGDLISIEDATEGTVVQMNWRSIHLRTADADIAVIPNSIVAKSRIVNRSRPTEQRAVTTDLSSRTDRSSQQLLEHARQALLLCPTILPDPPATTTVKAAGKKRLVIAASYSVSHSNEIVKARGELLQNFRRMLRHAAHDATLADTQSFISDVTLFDGLSPSQQASIAEAVETRFLERGARLFEAGTTGSSLFIVRSGVLEIVRTEGGVTRTLGRLGPGEYIGELSMMTGDKRYVAVDALTSVTILELAKAALEHLLTEDVELGRRLERAVRRGMDLIDQDNAARAGAVVAVDHGMLERLRHFLRC